MPISSTSGIGEQLALLAHRQRHDHDAGEAQAPPVRDRARLGRNQQRAVLVEPRGRYLVDHARRAGREAHQIAVAAQNDLGDAGRARELGVLGEMQRLAVHRNGDARLHPAIKLRHLGAARMAGDVHQMRAVGDDLDALPHQPVDELADRLLVARDGARGEDHQVALRERHLGVLVLGDARERGARLALAAGAQRHDLVVRQVAIGLDACGNR